MSPDALLVVNQAGTIAMANEQIAALFGYRREELQGQKLEMLLPQRFREAHTTHREHYFIAPRTRPMGPGSSCLGSIRTGRSFR